jgi:hypothetical protein
MIGKIISLNTEKRFGFVSSENSQNYYFKIRDFNFNLRIGDDLTYNITDTINGPVATEIRKVFTNGFGLKFIPRVNEHHIHINLEDYLPQIINKIDSNCSDDIIKVEHEFPFYIGETICVKTNSNSNIVYCIRKGRLGHSRLVTNASPEKCKHVTAIFKKIEDGYLILTIYIGRIAAREPWDKSANSNDLLFWKNNALIYDPNDVISGSETHECPWELNQYAISKLKSY